MTLLSTADWLLSPSTQSPAGLGAAVGAAGVGTQHAISDLLQKCPERELVLGGSALSFLI